MSIVEHSTVQYSTTLQGGCLLLPDGHPIHGDAVVEFALCTHLHPSPQRAILEQHLGGDLHGVEVIHGAVALLVAHVHVSPRL